MSQETMPLDQLLDQLRLSLYRYRLRRRRRSLYALAIATAGVTATLALGATYGHWWDSPAPFRAVDNPFPVPRISGHDLVTGRPLSNADFAGRAGFLIVWQSYCEPCKGELTAVQAFATAYPQIPVIGLDTEPPDTPARGRAMLKQSHATFPAIIVSQSILLSLKLRGYPSILAFNAKGKIVAISAGYGGRTPSDLLAAEAARITG